MGRGPKRRAAGPTMTPDMGFCIPNVSAMMRVSGRVRPRESSRPGISVTDPFHRTGSGVPSCVRTASPGNRSSIAIGPVAVSTSDPRVKAQNASSKTGRAGAMCRTCEISPFFSSEQTSYRRSCAFCCVPVLGASRSSGEVSTAFLAARASEFGMVIFCSVPFKFRTGEATPVQSRQTVFVLCLENMDHPWAPAILAQCSD